MIAPSDRLADFNRSIGQTYVAAMFDIDGTLTEPGRTEIPADLLALIGKISTSVACALCTGRRFEGMLERLQKFIDSSPDPEAARKNWYLFLENGSIGMEYNPQTQKYEPFYKVDWPSEQIDIFELVKTLTPKVEAIEPCEIRINECSLGVYPLYRAQYAKEKLAGVTAQIARTAHDVLRPFPGRTAVRIIDSGVAMHIIPSNGDKDRGIREFARILRKERKLHLDADAREILIIGDQPGPGKNDEKFLAGRWGTPFTAEHTLTGNPYPIPIFENETILKGPRATLSLLKRIRFR